MGTKRYVVLWEDMALRFYETESRGNVIGKIKVGKTVNNIKKLSESQSYELDPNNPYFFSIMSSSLKKTWQFGCDDMEKLSEWVHILQSALTIKKEKEKEKEKEDNNIATDNNNNNKTRNHYVGHHGHNMSNMEDFSVAQSMSSRASSIQSLSAF